MGDSGAVFEPSGIGLTSKQLARSSSIPPASARRGVRKDWQVPLGLASQGRNRQEIKGISIKILTIKGEQRAGDDELTVAQTRCVDDGLTNKKGQANSIMVKNEISQGLRTIIEAVAGNARADVGVRRRKEEIQMT